MYGRYFVSLDLYPRGGVEISMPFLFRTATSTLRATAAPMRIRDTFKLVVIIVNPAPPSADAKSPTLRFVWLFMRLSITCYWTDATLQSPPCYFPYNSFSFALVRGPTLFPRGSFVEPTPRFARNARTALLVTVP